MTIPTGSTQKTVVIRDIESLAEMREVERLQREIWGVEDLDVYPALALKPQKELGAILIGAFADDRMVGFVFGFPGVFDGETIIHSDMLGVTSSYRSYNLGYLLKRAQRDAALAQGITRITWTFDPLRARNAHLNFGKLGVVADRYHVDYYGETSSFLHRFGTDRLWVTWWLRSERVESRLQTNAAPRRDESELVSLVHAVRVGKDLEPLVSDEGVDSPELVIQIPAELNAHQEAWRAATRAAFTRALDQGFVVNDFFVSTAEEPKTGRYILSR